jgi:hypothetical protein
MTSFAVVTPSRGLVHSRSVESVMAAIEVATAAGHEFRGWRLSHDLPIPDCDNDVAERGLATGAETLFWVEEDMVIPERSLLAQLALFEAGHQISAVDYPVGADNWGCIAHNNGDIPWCGLGCTLIGRAVFDAIARPWFRTDKVYAIVGQPGARRFVERDDPRPAERKWGQQDIWFFRQAIEAGFTITEVPGMSAGQAKVRELGKPATNVGWHQIELVTEIRKQQFV